MSQRSLLRSPAALLLATILFVALPSLSSAESSNIDISRLTNLFEALLRTPESPLLQSRIEEERARIRSAINQELSLQIASKEQQEKGGEDLPSALTRQGKLLNSFEQQLQETKVDLDLLRTEEKNVYLDPPAGSGSLEEFRMSTSYTDLLAKRALVEERLTALESLLPIQEQRLTKLQRQQWIDRFSLLIRIASYAGLLLLFILAERFIRSLLLRRFRLPNQRYLFSKVFSGTVYAILTVWILSLLFARFPGALTSIGIVAAGLAVALQDVVKDVVGWLFIIQRRPFTLGHRIAIGHFTGDVIDISVLRTTLLEVNFPATPAAATPLDSLERSGKTLVVPNSLLLTQPVLNYHATSDFLKSEMHITITYESPWKKAQEILREIVDEETGSYTEKARVQHQNRMWLFHRAQEPTNAIVYMEAGASGIVFTLRFPTPIGERRSVVTRISEQILSRFAKENIHIAYTTYRVIPTPSNAND